MARARQAGHCDWLSKAVAAGVKLRPPARRPGFGKIAESAASAYRKGQRGDPVSSRRSQASVKALRREGRSAAFSQALSTQARSAAHRRTSASRSAGCQKAARTRSQERLGLSVVGGPVFQGCLEGSQLGFG